VKGEEIALMFSVVGRGTQWLSECKEGERLDLLGPLGRGFGLPPSPTRILLVGGGRGISPLIFLSEWALNRGFMVSIILGARSKRNLYPTELIPSGVDLDLATEDGSYGYKGRVTDLLSLSDEVDHVYACGPSSMYQAMAPKLRGREAQVLLEVRMGCGVGACCSCTINTRRGSQKVCRDGPVFLLEDILWGEVKL
jgi:dihydroorotate dehydrogenase electron transfer subunit